jgi:molybdopterin biosynthesis enzyme
MKLAMALVKPYPGIVELRPIQPGQKAALLLVGEPAVHQKLIRDFEPPTRTRLKKLGATLTTVKAVPQTIAAIQEAVSPLIDQYDLLIIAGQTSVMDPDDTILYALREMKAVVAVHGAPVEPGNLMALAYFPNTPVMCAPGCARDLNHNVVDMILPRLLLGDRLGRREIAELGLGGLLK